MRIVSRPFKGSGVAAAWMEGSEVAARLFAGDPRSIDAFRKQAELTKPRFGRAERLLAAEALSGGGEDGRARLERWVDAGGLAITTGQQPGLFGGPLYCLYKGLTAVALARRVEEALGIPVIPVYWVASEDHGWDGARSITVLDQANDLQAISLPPIEGAPDRPLQRIPLGPAIVDAIDTLAGFLPDSEFSGRWLDVLRRTHRPEVTIGDALEAALAEITRSTGLFFVQAQEARLKERAMPLLLRELEESALREEAVLEGARRITDAGFDLQVPHLEGGTNLFLEGEKGRERLFRDGSSFRLRGSDRHLSLDDIRSIVGDDPSLLSPNVLLRPVVESVLFPTLCYVAGPGEAAYLPQTTPVFEGHGIARPLVHPRATLTVVEGKVQKVLEKFSLEIEELAEPAHEIAGRLAREEIPHELSAALAGMKAHLGTGAEALKAAISAVDPTLAKTVDSFRNQGFSGLADVERKVVQSLKKTNEVALRQVEKAQVNLYPGGAPQERVFSPFYYLARYDESFLDAAREAATDAVLP